MISSLILPLLLPLLLPLILPLLPYANPFNLNLVQPLHPSIHKSTATRGGDSSSHFSLDSTSSSYSPPFSSTNPTDILGPPRATVWSYFGSLTPKYNLGQGFPDTAPPQFALDALKETINGGDPFIHQYTRTSGHPALCKELASRYSNHLGRDINWEKNVAVTVGASQALYMGLQTVVRPGDEVIVFEPYFDLYLNQIR